MESGNAFGVPGSIKGPLGLVIKPGRVFCSSQGQLYLWGQELGREWALTSIVLYLESRAK